MSGSPAVPTADEDSGVGRDCHRFGVEPGPHGRAHDVRILLEVGSVGTGTGNR